MTTPRRPIQGRYRTLLVRKHQGKSKDIAENPKIVN